MSDNRQLRELPWYSSDPFSVLRFRCALQDDHHEPSFPLRAPEPNAILRESYRITPTESAIDINDPDGPKPDPRFQKL
jgi:hypothetical protein